jgi:predicted RNA-binding protein YlqC (UPF0109 family)
MADYGDLVEYIVKSIVDHPDAAEVEVSSRNRADIVEIRLDPEDVGRVIGKGGRTIEAIRSVVKAAAVKDHRRVNVEVIADEEPPERVAVSGATSEAEPADDPEGSEE